MQYNPNFVGLFPADAPQLVVVVRVSNPKGDFYGGRTAAPMTKAIVQAALASRDAAIDPSALRRRSTGSVVQAGARPAATVAATARQSDAPEPTTSPVVMDLVAGTPARETAVARSTPSQRRVPNVTGMTLREAVRSLHYAGFRVQLVRGEAGSTSPTQPAAGTSAAVGSIIRLRSSR